MQRGPGWKCQLRLPCIRPAELTPDVGSNTSLNRDRRPKGPRCALGLPPGISRGGEGCVCGATWEMLLSPGLDH